MTGNEPSSSLTYSTQAEFKLSKSLTWLSSPPLAPTNFLAMQIEKCQEPKTISNLIINTHVCRFSKDKEIINESFHSQSKGVVIRIS